MDAYIRTCVVIEEHKNPKNALMRAMRRDPDEIVIIGSQADLELIAKEAGYAVEVLPSGSKVPSNSERILPVDSMTEIDDPNAVINALTVRIGQLERANEFLNNELKKYTGLPSQVGDVLRHMRKHAIIPLYVGDLGREALEKDFAIDESTAEAFKQVWFLSNAPVGQESKDAIHKAANYGMSRF